MNYLLFSIPLLFLPGIIYAEPIHIGLEFSSSCLALISVNDTKTCGSPELLQQIYPETKLIPSFQNSFEETKKIPKDYAKAKSFLLFKKLDCIKNNYCNIFDNVSYWHNPDNLARPYFDILITIQTNMKLSNYNKTANPITTGDNSRQITYDVYNLHIEDCRKAIYDPDVLWKEIGHIIHYMINDCENERDLGTLKTIYSQSLPKHELDVTSSPNYQATQKLKEDMERCKTKC